MKDYDKAFRNLYWFIAGLCVLAAMLAIFSEYWPMVPIALGVGLYAFIRGKRGI